MARKWEMWGYGVGPYQAPNVWSHFIPHGVGYIDAYLSPKEAQMIPTKNKGLHDRWGWDNGLL